MPVAIFSLPLLMDQEIIFDFQYYYSRNTFYMAISDIMIHLVGIGKVSGKRSREKSSF